MKRVLERDISKEWIRDHLEQHPEDYAFRICDTPWGGYKLFDWFLFSGNVAWALEFKVNRKKTLRYKIAELPAHQLKALKAFTNGRSRRSKVVVYHMATEKWHEMEISHDTPSPM